MIIYNAALFPQTPEELAWNLKKKGYPQPEAFDVDQCWASPFLTRVRVISTDNNVTIFEKKDGSQVAYSGAPDESDLAYICEEELSIWLTCCPSGRLYEKRMGANI